MFTQRLVHSLSETDEALLKTTTYGKRVNSIIYGVHALFRVMKIVLFIHYWDVV